MASLKSWIGRRPVTLRRARPRLDRLEDRTVPAFTPYFPPSVFITNPALTAVNPPSGPQQQLTTALSFLSSHAADLRLAPGDLSNPIVTSQYTDADTGIGHIYLEQQVNGLPVINADFSIGIAANGAVISAGGGFVTGLSTAMGTTVQWPRLTATDAVRAAATDLGLTLPTDPTFVNEFVGPVAKPLTAFTVAASTVSLDAISAKLVYAPTPDGGAAVAWDIVVRTPDGQHWYDMSLDGRTGAVLAQTDWIDNDAYNVVPPPNESPQDGGFTVVTNPPNQLASPFGWQDTNGVAGPEFTNTQGNNVDAHLDVDDDDVPDPSPGRPDGGAALNFSGFTYNPTQSPSTVQNQMAAQVNLFYMNNLLHDVHYQYGFTEAAGNFQVNNYGNGGAGSDPVQADAQDGSGIDNANFGTPPDGSSPRMQMYLWDTTNPGRDGDFDDSVIIHEFGHGVSNRLTGGPADSDALDAIQSGGMGEGWSDFYALMFLQRPADTQNAGYGIGTYVLGQPNTGLGIRREQYSYNMAIDPLTWGDYGGANSVEVHDTGEIWTTTLWDMNWLLINKYGYDSNLATGWSASPGPAHAGNKLALRLVMDGLKLQPANPSFTEARDAIVAADVALNGGADLNEIWSAFARRGLGQGAIDVNSDSTDTPTLSFTLPMLVASVGPATGAVVSSHPATYTLNVTSPINPGTLDASDFVVNGQAATGVSYVAGATTATFTFATDPVSGQGLQTIQIAAGAFTRSSDGAAVAAYSSTFYYDPTPLTVTAVSPAAGTMAPPPLTTVDVTLNQPIDPASVQTSDLSIDRGTVTGVALLNGNTTVRFTVANIAPEQAVTIGIAAGAFFDLQGNPNAAFDDGAVSVDQGVAPFPTPLQAVAPVGSLAYTGSISSAINYPGDVDGYTLTLDANQLLSLTATPDAGLRASLAITGPGTNLTVTGSAAGIVAQLGSIPITTAGTYTITVAGVGAPTGAYVLGASLNVVQEAETTGGPTDNTMATAQSLAPAFLNQGGGLAVANVHGRSDQLGLVSEVEPNNSTATATSAAIYTTAPASTFYQLGISGTLSNTADGDYFNIGTMQAGDVLTISESAAGSARGTESDPYLQLYRAGSTTPVAFDDDSGPTTDNFGHDSLIYRFTVTAADTYYVRAYRYDVNSTPGTYQLAILLQNAGTAPTTGGTFTAETEPNDTVATANNAANAWRPANYLSTAAGALTGGDTDIYSYQFSAGDVVSLVTQSTSGLFPAVAFLNTAGTALATDNGTSAYDFAGGFAPLYGYVIPASGRYYLRVTSADGSTGSYTATVTVSTTATLPLAPPVFDYFSFNLAAGQAASTVIKGATTGLHIAVLDSTGTVVATGAAGPTNVDEVVNNFTAPTAGVYYLRVNGTANVDYQASVITGGTFEVEPNTVVSPQQLFPGSPILGAINGGDDWFKVNLTPGAVITLTTTTPGGSPGEFTNTLDPLIELYDPNVTLVGSDDNSAGDGRNATLTRTAAMAGTYRVHVTGAGGSSGEYTLSTAVTTPTPPTVSGVVVGDGTVERSEVRSIAVTFSGPVNFTGGDSNAGAAFQLQHVADSNNVNLTTAVSINGLGQTVVTLTFSGAETDVVSGQNGGQLSLIDGRYSLTILSANVTGSTGLVLAGGGPSGNYVSPTDTLGGGAGQLGLYRLFGDTNGDGVVDQVDLGQFRSTFNASTGNPLYLSFLDADNTGTVDQVDLGQFRSRFNLNVF